MFRVPNLRAIKAWVISRIPTKISDLVDDVHIVTEDRIATTDKAGILKPDGTTLKVDDDGTAYASGAVSNDYRDFIHKPRINGVELEEDCSLDELGAVPLDLVGVSKDATGNTNIDYSYYDADTGSTKAKAGLDNLRNALEDSTTEIATNMQKLDEKIPVEPVNNLLATVPGTALDAVQGKVLDDKIEEVSASLTNLGGFTPVIDETTGRITGYKTEIGGADSVFPFSGDKIPCCLEQGNDGETLSVNYPISNFYLRRIESSKATSKEFIYMTQSYTSTSIGSDMNIDVKQLLECDFIILIQVGGSDTSGTYNAKYPVSLYGSGKVDFEKFCLHLTSNTSSNYTYALNLYFTPIFRIAGSYSTDSKGLCDMYYVKADKERSNLTEGFTNEKIKCVAMNPALKVSCSTSSYLWHYTQIIPLINV